MLNSLVTKIVGSKNDRYLKSLNPLVERINSLEPEFQAMKNEDFPARVAEYKDQAAQGRSLEDLLPPVFAMVREASVRSLGMRHFDVQLVGGMVLHAGKIAEMKTGEGKTLVATLPVVLNALTGRGVHIVTVNDYLARRDAEWMGHIYKFLGLTVGNILHGLADRQRQQAYGSDITYGTNNEFGFDYLRDNMKFYKESLVQRDLHYAIVDAVDSILIDEARTPLIISGPSEGNTGMYAGLNAIVSKLKQERDYTLDEKARSVSLTDEGVARCEQILQLDNLYDPKNITFQHHILQALKAHRLYTKDVDYIVKEGQVVIVDEFTGRLMPGRRFSDGLHQALEAKEGVKVENENQTLASITFQNYFRMYDKLAGMTGTADTEAVEFRQIYDLEVSVIPTHMKMIRVDHPDSIYKSQTEKFKAIVEEIKGLHGRGQPVLVGTISIEKSELLRKMLTAARIPHNVLNAKQHEKEAQIVAEAGQPGKVTIATNMAGRGTDIKLGEGVVALGGLHIIGTERHESRRIDNQLRGRSGRQGDPGSSRFYLALDADLMRLFGSDRIAGIMSRLGMKEGESIENRMVSKAIENAQSRVENHHFEIRKQLLDFDNVMNQQREVIYNLRRETMSNEDMEPLVIEYLDDLLDEVFDPIEEAKGKADKETLDLAKGRLEELFALSRFGAMESLPDREEVRGRILGILDRLKQDAQRQYDPILRFFVLESLDRHWKEHLLNMDHLREGIGLRGYGQRDPKQEYKREGFNMFQDMLMRIRETTLKALTRLRVQQPDEKEFVHKEQPQQLNYSGKGEALRKQPQKRAEPKVGRNDPCPCGSGKKYKKCHGQTA